MTIHPGERGLALVLVLILLLVGTLIAVSGMGAALMDEQMAHHKKLLTESQMTAEAGAKEFFAWLADQDESVWNRFVEGPGQCDTESECQEALKRLWADDLPSSESDARGVFGDNGRRYYIESVEPIPAQDVTMVRVVGQAVAGEKVISESVLDVAMSRRVRSNCELSDEAKSRLPGLPPGVNLPACGIISEGRMRFNGAASFSDATLYSNTDIVDQFSVVTTSGVTLENASIGAAGDIDTSGDPTCIGTCSVDPFSPREMDIPSVADSIEFWRTHPDAIHTCDGDDVAGDLDGAVIFCDGDFRGSDAIQGDFFNGTIVATGDIVHNGSVKGEYDGPGDPPLAAVIAGGDITLNGSTSAEDGFPALFWTDGEVTFNGQSNIFGAIISSGVTVNDDGLTVTSNGQPTFKGLQAKGYLNEIPFLAISGWTDAEPQPEPDGNGGAGS